MRKIVCCSSSPPVTFGSQLRGNKKLCRLEWHEHAPDGYEEGVLWPVLMDTRVAPCDALRSRHEVGASSVRG